MNTLSIDIGGSGIKMLVLDEEGRACSERVREPTPQPASPDAVLERIRTMIDSHDGFDRISVGFPGVVTRGVVRTAANLSTEPWIDFDLQECISRHAGRPTRVVNDADLQGFGVVAGEGVELVLTLGTGLGSALFTDGRPVPNLEIAHHPFRKGETYEDRMSDAERRRIGKKRWRKRMARIFAILDAVFNHDRLHVGGGNARHLEELPPRSRVFDNEEGLTGGVALWRRPEARQPGWSTKSDPDRGSD